MALKLDREELAWAAGLFDGEGTIGYYKKAIHLAIGQAAAKSCPEVLIRFKTAVGNLGTIGGPYGPYPSKLGKRPHWTFRANNFEHVQAIVAMLWNWLSEPKRQQARAALLAAQGR